MKVRRILLLATTLIAMTTISLYAQPGGGMGGGMGGRSGSRSGGPGGQQGGPGMQMQQNVDIDLLESSGMFLLDRDDITDNCKIKDEDVKTKINSLLAVYVTEYDNITLEFGAQIDSLNAVTEASKASESGPSGDMIKAIIPAMQKIRKRTTPMHTAFNEGMVEILSEKEAKRWDAYYKKLCSEKFFRIGGKPGEGERGERGEMGERPQRDQNMSMGEEMDDDMMF